MNKNEFKHQKHKSSYLIHVLLKKIYFLRDCHNIVPIFGKFHKKI